MHMQRKWSSGVLFSLLFTLVLTACSSGGGDSAATVVPAGTAEGLWTGTTTGTIGGGRTIGGVVLDDGTYWFLYSAVNNPAVMAGALQGNGSAQNGTFASSNGLYFSNDAPAEKHDVTVTGPYVMQQDLSGTLTFPNAGGGTLAFTSMFDPEYNVAPVIANVAGTYPGSVFGFPHTIRVTPSIPVPPSIVPSSADITVTTTGGPHTTGVSNVTGIELGCDFTGTLIPRSNGNVYDISLTPSTNAIMCHPDTLTGVAFFDAAATKVYVLALNSSRTRVFPFTGTKQ